MKRFFLVLLCAAAIARAEDIVFPDDAVVDVTKAPYSAKGDGAADDTAAIQKALDEGRHLIYLPNGTYLISNGLRWGKTQKHTVLQGQSRDGTIIKLKDECGGFNLPDKPLPMIWTGKSPPIQRFGNGIRNLHTGRYGPWKSPAPSGSSSRRITRGRSIPCVFVAGKAARSGSTSAMPR